MATPTDGGALPGLAGLSDQLAAAAQAAGASVVKIDDGTRLTASGLILSADGVIAATSHGVERDEELFVHLADGSRHPASVVGRDPESDVAVLRVEATGLSAFTPAAADSVRIGSLVLAVARPGGGGLQATIGIVSARHEAQDEGRPEYILSTDAALFPGFSGGALVNVQGHLVGMLNLMFGRRSGVAVGAPMVANVVESLLAHGRIKRGYLGVGTQVVALPASVQGALGRPQEVGLMLVHVAADGPAEKAGLTIGDILLTADGAALGDVDELRSRLRKTPVGASVALEILRGGALHRMNATLGEEKRG